MGLGMFPPLPWKAGLNNAGPPGKPGKVFSCRGVVGTSAILQLDSAAWPSFLVSVYGSLYRLFLPTSEGTFIFKGAFIFQGALPNSGEALLLGCLSGSIPVYPSPCRVCPPVCCGTSPIPQSAAGAVAIGMSWDCDLTTLQPSVLGGQVDVSAKGP